VRATNSVFCVEVFHGEFCGAEFMEQCQTPLYTSIPLLSHHNAGSFDKIIHVLSLISQHRGHIE